MGHESHDDPREDANLDLTVCRGSSDRLIRDRPITATHPVYTNVRDLLLGRRCGAENRMESEPQS